MSGIETWTRRVLEDEARKRGIRDPEARSHLELARLILRHDYAATRGTRRMIGKLLGSAAAKLPIVGSEWAAAPPIERRVSARPHSVTNQAAQASTARTGGAQTGAGGVGAGAAASTQDRAQAARTAPLAERTALGAATLPKPAALGVAPLRERAALGPAPNAVPLETTAQPIAANDSVTPSAADENRLDHERNEPGALHLRWQVSEQGTARARALLGAPGELALRIVSVRADQAYVVHSEVSEHGPIESAGEWTTLLASPDTHCVTAVGLRSADRFVSIVHTSSRP